MVNFNSHLYSRKPSPDFKFCLNNSQLRCEGDVVFSTMSFSSGLLKRNCDFINVSGIYLL